MKSIRNILGDNVRELRKARKMTQSELAKNCDLSLSFLQNIEAGTKWASAETIECLSKNLEVRESDLFREHGQSTEHDARSAIEFLCKALGVKLS